MQAPVSALLYTVAGIEEILELAQHFAVFPCRAQSETIETQDGPKTYGVKSPHINHWDKHASQNAQQIRTWWNRWPDALVGVPTGIATGLTVVDYDVHKDDRLGKEWLQAHSNQLVATRSHATLNGGRHYLFWTPAGEEYSGGSNLTLDGARRGGIDVRSSGGYIIWWPLHGAIWGGDIIELPPGLLDERRIEVRDLLPLPKFTPEQWARDKGTLTRVLPYIRPAEYDEWTRAGMVIHLASGRADEGFDLWHAWSAGELTGECPENYAGVRACRYKWASFSDEAKNGQPRGPVKIGSLVHLAKERGFKTDAAARAAEAWIPLPDPPAIETAPLESYLNDREVAVLVAHAAAARTDRQPGEDDDIEQRGNEEAALGTVKSRAPIHWPSLDGLEPPEREWAMEYWLPQGHPALLAGRGGIGKTLMAQHIATAMIVEGTSYVAKMPKPLKVLIWAGEDDEAEMWRRQIPIAGYFGVSLKDLHEKLIVHSYEGCDITLAAPVFNVLQAAPLMKALIEQVRDYKADYVFLDNIARIYGGDESNRHQVTQFMAWISAACKPAGVCLLGHPAKAQGSEYSGSTAWEGAVRSRLYLGDRLPDVKEELEAEPPDPAARYLSRRKANYSHNDWRRLNYINGVLIPEEVELESSGPFRVSGEYARNVVRSAVLKLKDVGIFTTASPASPAYLPKVAKQYGYLDRMSERQMGQVMREMIKDKVLATDVVGKYSNRSDKKGLTVKS
jgi:AAA domain/Bifunctional DNA primase/polymerase, N-terminal/Primase C terminal 2 (PriCT-2)